MKRDRVLFSALTLHSRLGGIQRFNQRVVRTLAEAHPAGAVQVHVLEDRPADCPEPGGMQGFDGRKLAFILATLRAARRARLFAIDHVALLPLAALARLIRPRLPILMFAHGIEVWGDEGARPVRLHHRVLMRLAVSRVACVSSFTAAKLQRAFRYPARRVRLLPNAVDALPAVPGRADTAGAATVLVVTRLSASEPYKNVDKVILAAAQLAAAFPSLRLDIVGDGDARPVLVALADAQGIADRVRFLGRVSDEELAAAYARASVLALPSTGEGFGIAYLEAWQRGLPVIGSTEGAAPEVIEHGRDGLLVEAVDIGALARAIETLLREPALARRLGEAGLAKTKTVYAGEAFRRNLLRITRDLLATSP
jgi:glycosyltransferase involved in cell wall biosynthesis